tara:strand:- start:478 stop:720 length:243 start_codon:yes stop_codon:yes gene_type:complete
MNKGILTLLIAVVILLVLVFYKVYLDNNTEKFKENDNNEVFIDPFKINLAPLDKSCKNDIKDKSYVSVAEFMAGERYKCY